MNGLIILLLFIILLELFGLLLWSRYIDKLNKDLEIISKELNKIICKINKEI